MKFLHFAFAGGWSGLLYRKGLLHSTYETSLRDTANLNVGGHTFTVCAEDVRQHPTSSLYQIVQSAKHENEVNVGRSGPLFRLIYAYLINGQLPKNIHGKSALGATTLQALKSEASYYGLTKLEEECSADLMRKSGPDLASFLDLHKYFNTVGCDLQEVEFSSTLISSIQDITSPFCSFGKLNPGAVAGPIYGNSTIDDINLSELIATAQQSPFGRGAETVVDTNVRDSFEIEASCLNTTTTSLIASEVPFEGLAPHLNLTLRPYKLVIYKEGGHFAEHRDTVRGDGHIGTLVVILNSPYTGGELEVTHGGRTEVATGPYSWVAMYGDCLHKINPVTSGTRVSLIYDIYPSGKYEKEEQFWGPLDVGKCITSSTDMSQRSFVPNNEAKDRMITSLESELKTYDTLVVCLQHLYPECQTNAAFLKGGDRVLYDILTERGAYEVQVVGVTINHVDSCYDSNYTGWKLFSPSMVHNAEVRIETTLGRAKLLVPAPFVKAGLVDYWDKIWFTGNMAQDEQSKYLVAGLQIRRKNRTS